MSWSWDKEPGLFSLLLLLLLLLLLHTSWGQMLWPSSALPASPRGQSSVQTPAGSLGRQTKEQVKGSIEGVVVSDSPLLCRETATQASSGLHVTLVMADPSLGLKLLCFVLSCQKTRTPSSPPDSRYDPGGGKVNPLSLLSLSILSPSPSFVKHKSATACACQ